MAHFPITNNRCKVPVHRYLLVVFVFSCTLQGRSNGRYIPATTLSSNQYGTMAVEPPTPPGQDSGPLMYSRYWIAYASLPFPRLTDDNRASPSHDQRLNSPYPSLTDIGSPSTSSADSDLSVRSSADSDLSVRSSADSDPMISSRRSMIGLDGPKVRKDRGSPMILFDEHGEMHRNYYTTPTTDDSRYK